MKISNTRAQWLARLGIILALIAMFGALAPAASAHPLGNFTINHYSRLELSTHEVRLRYILDYAEIPTFQEKQTIDKNGDGTLSDDEQAEYLDSKLVELRAHLFLDVNGKPVPLSLVPHSIEFQYLPGQGGLSVTRLSTWFSA